MCRGARFTYKHVCVECKDRGSNLIASPVNVKVPPASNDNDIVSVIHPTTGKTLAVTIRIKDNDQFRRRGYDVFTNVFIPYSMAVLGGKQTVSSLYGGEIQVQIPAGTETDTNIRLSGRGIEKKDSSTHGDHVLVIKIKVPKLISEKQKSLLTAFATLENHPVLETQSSQIKSFHQEALIMAKKNAIHFRSAFVKTNRPNN